MRGWRLVVLSIDPVRFQLALRQAEATVESSRAALVEAARAQSLPRADDTLGQPGEAGPDGTTALQQVIADHDTAKLNLAPRGLKKFIF
jgi:multidrug resistance efflux pump